MVFRSDGVLDGRSNVEIKNEKVRDINLGHDGKLVRCVKKLGQ
jgi:hypothetical protein